MVVVFNHYGRDPDSLLIGFHCVFRHLHMTKLCGCGRTSQLVAVYPIRPCNLCAVYMHA